MEQRLPRAPSLLLLGSSFGKPAKAKVGAKVGAKAGAETGGPQHKPRRERLLRFIRRRRTFARDLRDKPFDKAFRRLPRTGKRLTRKRLALAVGVSAVGLTAVAHESASTAQEAANATPAAITVMEEVVEAPTERRHASELSASEELLEAMIDEEGVRYTVYRDVSGFPTVGVGHLVLAEDGLSVGDRISRQQVMEFLEHDIAAAEMHVRKLVGDLNVNQHEFDALVDLVFNVGEGTVSRRKSPRLNAAIDAKNYGEIANQLEYSGAGGRKARGLVYRSERRTQIFLAGDYSDPREA